MPAFAGEEFLEQGRAFPGQDAALHFGLVIEPQVAEQVDDPAGRAGFRIMRAEYDFFEARLQDRAGAPTPRTPELRQFIGSIG